MIISDKPKKVLLVFLGFWIGVVAQDSIYFFNLANLPNETDLLIAGLMALVNFIMLIGLRVYFDEVSLEQDIGLPSEDQLSTDAKYNCTYCGDPVKKGDRVIFEDDIYCTINHLEADKE